MFDLFLSFFLLVYYIAGDVRFMIESALERGVAFNPENVVAKYNRLNITSGNFLTAAPVGIVNGVDYKWTGRGTGIYQFTS